MIGKRHPPRPGWEKLPRSGVAYGLALVGATFLLYSFPFIQVQPYGVAFLVAGLLCVIAAPLVWPKPKVFLAAFLALLAGCVPWLLLWVYFAF